MKKFLSILLFIVLTTSVFAKNEVQLGQVEAKQGTVFLETTESGKVSLKMNEEIFYLNSMDYEKFKTIVDINLEAINKIDTDSIDIVYKRQSGRMVTTDKKGLFFSLYYDGNGNSSLIIRIVTGTNPTTNVMTMNKDSIKETMKLCEDGFNEIKTLRSTIEELNDIVDKTKDIIHY